MGFGSCSSPICFSCSRSCPLKFEPIVPMPHSSAILPSEMRLMRMTLLVISLTSSPTPPHVVALVLEPDRGAIISEAPQVLLKAVVELPGPLTLEESDDLLASLEELVPIAPLRVLRVGQRHLLGVAGVPGVLSRFDLLPGTLLVERRYWRSDFLVLAALLHTVILLSASTTLGCSFYPAPTLSSAVVSHQSMMFPARIARPAIGLSPAPPSPWRKRGPSGWCCGSYTR